MKREFHASFQITKFVTFNVSYYTLGDNDKPYFTTSATEWSKNKKTWYKCGQCQEDILPEDSMAKLFYRKYDEYHLHDISQEVYDSLYTWIETLTTEYNYILRFKEDGEILRDISYREEKELSKSKLKRR